MLYWMAPYLTALWGPFRLFSSHLMLLAAGTSALASGFSRPAGMHSDHTLLKLPGAPSEALSASLILSLRALAGSGPSRFVSLMLQAQLTACPPGRLRPSLVPSMMETYTTLVTGSPSPTACSNSIPLTQSLIHN